MSFFSDDNTTADAPKSTFIKVKDYDQANPGFMTVTNIVDKPDGTAFDGSPQPKIFVYGEMQDGRSVIIDVPRGSNLFRAFGAAERQSGRQLAPGVGLKFWTNGLVLNPKTNRRYRDHGVEILAPGETPEVSAPAFGTQAPAAPAPQAAPAPAPAPAAPSAAAFNDEPPF